MMPNDAGRLGKGTYIMTDAGSGSRQTGIPEIAIGTHIVHGTHDITVSGVASGGMGLVAWGPNRILGGEMEAVKLPRLDRLATASHARRAAILADFEREALTWCHLWAHPCIVSTQGLLRLRGLGNLPAIFIQYAPKGSLRDLLQRVHRSGSTQALGLEGVFAWGQMVAAALATIHQPAPDLERPEPLVHCDLKPENVLLNEHGWALLTDLGLTRALASLADTTASPSAAVMAGGVANALTAEQQAQVEQLRRLLAQAEVAVSPNGLAPGLSAPVALPEGALYATRTICVSPAQQAALIAAYAPGAGIGTDQSIQSALPVLSLSATAVVERMGSRGPVAGTPPYMAPEQWLGLDAVEPASDVYALGVLLFELFAGVGGRAGYPHTPNPMLVLTVGPFAAWCAAHASGPSRRLADAEVAALTDGPLVKLLDDGHQSQAEEVLTGLDALIGACLAFSPAARPTARKVQERLATLAGLAGLEPVAIPEYPRTPEREAGFWENLGITYTEMGQPKRRLPLQYKAVALTPDNPQRHTNLGNALGQLAQDEQQAAAAVDAKGDHAEAQRFEAQARSYREEAVRAYQEAEALLTPEWSERYPYLAHGIPYNLGAVLSDLRRYAEAIAARQRSLAADPNHAMSHRGLALIYLRWARESGTSPTERIERLEQAEAHMRQVLALAPHFADGKELLTTIQRELAAARRDAGRDVK